MKRNLGLALIALPIISLVAAAAFSYPFGGLPVEGIETDDTYILVLQIPIWVLVPSVTSILAGIFLVARDSNKIKR
jgi:hypothetical protein